MEDSRQSVQEPWLVELRRGLEKLHAGEFGLAEAHFSRAHRWAPTRPEVCLALGRERLRRGDAAAAEPLLRIACEQAPDLISAAATLARCLGLHEARFADAHAVLDAALERHPESATLQVIRAELLIEAGDAAAAIAAASAAVAWSSEDALAHDAARCALARGHNLAGTRLADAGELHQALFSFKKATDLDPEWASPWVNRGAVFHKLGKRSRAAEHYARALSIEPGSATAHANLGKLHLEQGSIERAVHHYSEAVELLPTDPDLWVGLAAASVAAGACEDAEDYLRQAIDLDGRHLLAHCRLAELLARDGRYVEAATLAERAQRIDPDRVPDSAAPNDPGASPVSGEPES